MPEGPTLSRAAAEQFARWEASAAATDQSALDVVVVLLPAGVHGANERRDLIRSAFFAGFPVAALAALRALVAADDRDAEANLLLCALLLRRGEPDAGPLLQRCLTAFPGAWACWVDVGEALLARGKREAALLCFAKGPPDAQLALQCGLIARDLSRRSETLAWFKRTVQLDPSSERGWFLLGTCAQDARDFALATTAYDAVLRLNPARVEAEVNRGMCLQAMGRLAEAKESYARAVRARPDSFGRIAQALPGSPKGELWLDLGALRRSLAG